MSPRSFCARSYLAVLLFASAAYGQTSLVWNGSASTDWNDPLNWTPNQVPTAADDVDVPSSAVYPLVTGVTVFARDLTISSLVARINIDATGVLEVGRNLVLFGRVRGSPPGTLGTLRLVGADASNIQTTGSQDVDLHLQKSGGTVTFGVATFGGSLVSTNTDVVVDASGYASFGFNAALSGGSFSCGSIAAFLDVPGTLSFSGTTANGLVAISCGDDFTADASFTPSSGVVSLVGTADKTVSVSGTCPKLAISGDGQVTILDAETTGDFEVVLSAVSLTLAAGVVMPIGGNFLLSGGDASCAAADAIFDATGDVTATGGATVTGLFNARCGGNWSSAASFAPTSGTIVFDGAAAATIAAAGAFFDCVVEGPGQKTFGTTTIAGALSVTGGVFEVAAGETVAILGAATFSGGAVSCADSAAAFDVALDATFSGATASLLNLFVGGDVAVDAAFAPTGGTTTLDGAAPRQISGAGVFADVSILGLGGVAAVGLSASGSVAVGPGSSLVAAGNVDVDGALSIDATAAFSDGGFDVAIGGDAAFPASAALSGLTIFDGPASATAAFAGTYANVRVAKIGPASVAFGALAVAGACDVLSGGANATTADFDGATAVASGATLAVAGATSFAGDLTVVGTLQIGGPLTFDGGTATASVASLPAFTVAKPGATLTLGPTVVSGAVAIQSGTLAAAGALDVAGAFSSVAAASFDGGPFTHDFRAALLLDGTTTASGAFRFSAPPAGLFAPPITARCTSGFPNVVVAAPTRVTAFGGGGTTTIGGSFTASGGTASWFEPTTVLGAATISGGALYVGAASSVALAYSQSAGGSTFAAPTSFLSGATFSGGVFSATSLVTIAGPTIFNGALATGAASIRALGDWTSGGLFNPTSGVVTFDGGGAPQTLFGAPVFHGMTIASNAVVSTAVTARTKGAATIAGQFSPTATFDADGAFAVVSGGLFDGGAAAHTFAGAFSAVSGGLSFAAGGRFIFDGAASATPTSVGPMPTIEVAKSGGVATLQNLSISGDLILTSGTTSTGANLSVSGSLFGNGGVLTAVDPTQRTLVAGSAVFAGTTAIAPALEIAVDFTSDAAFQPSGGIVRFFGATNRTIAGVGAFGDASLVVVDGTTNCLPALDVGGTFRVEPGATFLFSAATHVFRGNFEALGVVGQNGSLTFAPTSARSVVSAGPLPPILVAGSGGAPLLLGDSAVAATLVVASFDVASGAPRIAAGTTLAVSGDAVFTGGSFRTESGATLDVAGAFAATAATFAADLNLQVAGAFSADANFQPTSGAVAFDGAALQQATVAAPGAFRDVVVGTTAVVELQGATTVLGTTTVQGILQSPTTSSFRGAFVVAVGGEFDGGDAVHQFGGDVALAGQMTHVSTLIADGNGAASFGGTGAFPPVSVQKGPQGSLGLGGALPFAAPALDVVSGFVFVPASSVATITGAANFFGGAFASQNLAAILHVDGDASFASCDVSGLTSIDCGGSLTVDSSFTPTSGVVRFVGGGATALLPAAPGGTVVLPDFVVASGTTTLAVDAVIAADTTTVAAGATLRIAGASAQFSPTTFSIQGDVVVDVGGSLVLPDGSPFIVPPGAGLSLLGDPFAPATLQGSGPLGCDVRVQGALSARNFRILDPAASGLVIDVTATLAPAPNDLRGGLFSGPRAGGVLLDVRRSHPTAGVVDFRYLAFEDPSSAPGASNVRSPFGTPISFTNFSGAFGGEAFDDDPTNAISWNAPETTVLAGMTLTPGASAVTASFATTAEFDVEAFVLDRREPPGAFAFVDETPAIGAGGGGAAYQIVDMTAQSGFSYEYRLSARLTHGALVQLDVQSVVTLQLTPGVSGVFPVGPGRLYATPQEAIDAAPGLGVFKPLLKLDPGVHPAFTIAATPPGGLRIVGEPGAILDASAGPLSISGAAVGAVELRGLSIATFGGVGPAVVVGATNGVVIFDACSIDGGLSAGLVANGVVGLALQTSNVSGLPGLSADANAVVSIAGGSVSGIDASGGSIVRASGAVLGSTTTNGATLVLYAGPVATTLAPAETLLGAPCAVTPSFAPGAPWALFASLGLGYAPPAAPFEMPVYLDLPSLALLLTGVANGTGSSTIAFVTPPAPFLVGVSVSFQTAFFDTTTGAFRLSTVATTTVSG